MIITFSKKAKKQIEKLPEKTQSQIFHILEKFKTKEKKLDIKKIKGEEYLYRLRMNTYRIIYEVIKDEQAFHVIDITKRENSYRNL